MWVKTRGGGLSSESSQGMKAMLEKGWGKGSIVNQATEEKEHVEARERT
jgi:hypothetical protein